MIPIKTKEEIKIMAEGGKILARIMKELKKKVKPGITTQELNKVAEDLIFKSGAKSSFKGYQGFPSVLCTSINEEIVHGLPSNRILKKGDIITLDLGIFLKGFHSDMAVTLAVGEVDFEVARLIKVTRKALKIGIKKVRPGNTIGDVGNTIQRYIESQGFTVVRDLCGHGIGKELHEDPQILNYGKRKTGPKIREGMVLCLEPMATMGSSGIKKSGNDQTFETDDSSLSCHFEHEVAVTRDGCKVLTEI